MIQARARSTTQRRGYTTKPFWPAGTDDLHGGTQQVADPVHQAAGETGVGEDMPNRGRRVGGEQSARGAVAVLPGHGQDPDGDQEAEDVGDDESLLIPLPTS